jgi:hypothetical protein
MTVLALPGADLPTPAALIADRIDRASNTIGAFVLLPGVVLGAVMFVLQSL